ATQSETSYIQQSPTGRPPVAQSYSVELAEYSPMGPSQITEQPPGLSLSDSVDEAFGRYQQQLKVALEAISSGKLPEAGEEVMSLSRWFLSNVTRLGRFRHCLRVNR